MQLKHIILILITIVYAAYYVGVSNGMIKKDIRYGNESESRTALQRVVDAVTPDSPEEKRLRNKDTLENLHFQLNLAKKNYESYADWRLEAINNPPEWEHARAQLRVELENDKRPTMKARIEEYEKKIAELEGKKL